VHDNNGRHDEHNNCPEGALQRRAWMLDEIEDRFNNRIEIDYDTDESFLPVEIRYTYHSRPSRLGRDSVLSQYLPSTKSITLGYDSRSDVRQISIDGIDYTAKKILKLSRFQGRLVFRIQIMLHNRA
jgi:hypothetical protein